MPETVEGAGAGTALASLISESARGAVIAVERMVERPAGAVEFVAAASMVKIVAVVKSVAARVIPRVVVNWVAVAPVESPAAPPPSEPAVESDPESDPERKIPPPPPEPRI